MRGGGEGRDVVAKGAENGAEGGVAWGGGTDGHFVREDRFVKGRRAGKKGC